MQNLLKQYQPQVEKYTGLTGYMSRVTFYMITQIGQNVKSQ